MNAIVFPPITAVRTRGEGASHEGPTRMYNEDAFVFIEDRMASLAVVADGMGGHSTGRNAADLVINTSVEIFRGRGASILDDLAETWWVGEHGEGKSGGPRLRPYSSLPIVDRVELRERVQTILKKRIPESMGDVAVLEEERNSLLAIPKVALERANAEVYKKANTEPTISSWRGSGSAAVAVIFAAGQASIAHAGDCRVCRIRGGSSFEALTREHSLVNDYMTWRPDLTEQQIAELPANVITRAIGMSDTIAIDTKSVDVEKGDVFLLMSDGMWALFPPKDLIAAVRSHGTKAASWLVEQGKSPRPEHPGDNLTIVVVEIL